MITDPFSPIPQILAKLRDNDIIPYRTSEIEDIEGLCFYFKKENYNVYLEIYADLEMGYIVEDWINKKIITNVDIVNINDFIHYMKQGI